QAPASPPFDLEEVTIAGLQQRMQSGQDTSRSLVEKYLARIEAIDRSGPALHSVLEINPDALAIADRLDAERKSRGPRGPLHGIPVLIKDNIATADRMMTTAGSLALAGVTPPKDAFIVTRLREAGAVILGKTNLSEWANFRSTHSTSGWSGRGGQTKNPYALDRNPSGSSSGSGAAIAANLAAVAVGTETDGSIVSPSNNNGLVGIKPTLGLLSRSGIVPISHSQDTAGPMTRTVADAAALLGAMAGTDPDDAATKDAGAKGRRDYSASLDPNGLKGARIGVVRNKYFGSSPATDRLAEAAIAEMKKQGATIVDPANIPTLGKFDDGEFQVLLYEFKADLNKYLTWLGAASPVHSLKDVIAFNDAHADQEMPYFGQEIMTLAEKKGPLTSAKYTAALARNRQMARALGIDAVMTKFKLDALVAPTSGPAGLIDLVNGDSSGGGASPSTVTSVAGYPNITVPDGNIRGLPVGLSFFGRAWSEPTLIKLAYAYEQATKHRKPPTFAPTADVSR
ncbi:MAG TPA: amidase, partial [Vicinamibacterales bacterium]|nr:amidase [Vicinamibacterales bacterium]